MPNMTIIRDKAYGYYNCGINQLEQSKELNAITTKASIRNFYEAIKQYDEVEEYDYITEDFRIKSLCHIGLAQALLRMTVDMRQEDAANHQKLANYYMSKLSPKNTRSPLIIYSAVKTINDDSLMEDDYSPRFK